MFSFSCTYFCDVEVSVNVLLFEENGLKQTLLVLFQSPSNK